jgi:hypothetical protein
MCAMTPGEIPKCRRCGRAVERNRDRFDVSEQMHWSCFHYESASAMPLTRPRPYFGPSCGPKWGPILQIRNTDADSYAFEHDIAGVSGDPDIACEDPECEDPECEDPECPARAFDHEAGPSWLERPELRTR